MKGRLIEKTTRYFASLIKDVRPLIKLGNVETVADNRSLDVVSLSDQGMFAENVMVGVYLSGVVVK